MRYNKTSTASKKLRNCTSKFNSIAKSVKCNKMSAFEV